MPQGHGLHGADAATLHVGNLPFEATPDQLRQLFEPHCPVLSVELPNDPQTGQPRGFAFVSLPSSAVPAAVAALDGQTLLGRRLRVSIAQEHRRQARGPFRH